FSMTPLPSDIAHIVGQIYPLGRQHLAEALAREARALYWIGAIVSLGVLTATFFGGTAARVRYSLERRIRQPFALAATYVALLMLAFSLLSLPLEFYGSFTLSHRFGLSDEAVTRWLRDWSVGTVIDAAIAAVIGALLLRAIARFRRWPLIAVLAAGPLIFFGSAIYPLWVAPLFNTYRPLPPSPLSNAILRLAHEQGLNAAVVYEYDMSAQTHEANAYVAGLGATERIAVGDTLLRSMKPDEVLYVMAHEIGHYKLKHLWIGSLEGWAGAAVAIAWLSLAGNVILRSCPRRARSLADPAAAVLLAFLALIFQVVTAPASNALSRQIEHAADVFAAQHTQLGDAGVRCFARLANLDLSVLHPPRLVVWYFYTHPPTDERILYAAQAQKPAAAAP
ncbi:MAG: M48 family metalloprotease, partial [Candidatus Eremiobacteraeota bacterium]|nr:M48 family metalloprotease [Candidatus Eremiobacteraeota bacterium]